MKTRIISRLLIAREKDTWAILYIDNSRLKRLVKDFNSFQTKEEIFINDKNYLSIINCTRDTWTILCTSRNYRLKSICNWIRIRFFRFPKLIPEIFQIDENKNYLSVINCTRKGYVDHFVYIDDCFLKSICNWIRIRFFRFPKLIPKIFQIDEIKN